jgi:hypothetical protein
MLTTACTRAGMAGVCDAVEVTPAPPRIRVVRVSARAWSRVRASSLGRLVASRV